MDITKLNSAYAEKIQAAKSLGNEWQGKEDQMPVEVAKNIDGLLGQADEVKAKIQLAERMAQGEAYASESAGLKAAPVNWRQAGPTEGMPVVDDASWREIEIKSLRMDPTTGMVAPVAEKYRFHVPEAVCVKGYSAAFESYLHNGFSAMGPQDKKTLTVGTDSAGGFLVPDDYQTQLIKKMATMATIRARARVAQTARDIATWPKVHWTTDDLYTSGVRLTWVGESPASSSAHRVTDPVFGMYSIPVHTAMASMPLSNNLIEDSAFDVIGISQELLAEAFTLGENNVFINGTGVAQPMGILAKVGSDGPAAVNSGNGTALTADGLIDLVYSLPGQYDANAVHVMSKATAKAIRKLKDGQGGYLWPIANQVGNMGAAPRTLLDYPVMLDEFMPAIAANAYPAIFGDLRGYLILDRVGLSVQRLSELYAETNVTVLLARKRVGGQTIEPWRIKAHKVSA
jgi:HK97 family phage major capsid protein